jgi:hypothetical protein
VQKNREKCKTKVKNLKEAFHSIFSRLYINVSFEFGAHLGPFPESEEHQLREDPTFQPQVQPCLEML